MPLGFDVTSTNPIVKFFDVFIIFKLLIVSDSPGTRTQNPGLKRAVRLPIMLASHQDFKDYLEPIIVYSKIPKAFFTSSSPNISIA